MARLVVLTLLFFAGVCLASERIAGGNPTTIAAYPGMVQVESLGLFTGAWTQTCAASVLNSMFVLSSARCFSGIIYFPFVRRIRAGSSFRHIGGFIVDVAQEYNHPSYGSNGFDGDISVVRLETPLPMSEVVQQAMIIGPGAVIPDNVPVVIAGWGAVAQGALQSTVILDTQMFTINNELCRQRYQTLPEPANVTTNMICAGLLDVGGRDACEGDHGGPLYFSNIVVGVLSWVESCANATFPGVSTAVSPYTNWILETAVL